MNNESIYYFGEQWGQCQFCGKITDIRESFCFHCANAQSIIGTGVDMYDKNDEEKYRPDGDGPKIPVKYANKRLKLLIEKGWKSPE